MTMMVMMMVMIMMIVDNDDELHCKTMEGELKALS